MPMKILNNGRLCSTIFISFLLSGCATSAILATTKSTNLFDRSSIEIKDYKFFRVANTNDFSSCIKHLNAMCKQREMTVGESFDARQFSVSIVDRRASASETIQDYSMYLAGALSKQLGYDYFTAIKISDIGSCSSNPSAYSSGRVDSNGNYYGTTTVAKNTICSNLYTVTYLAFKDYEPVKHGILVKFSETRKPILDYDLYFGIVDSIKVTKSGDLGAIEYYQHHPIDAWKYYFPSVKTIQAAVVKYSLDSKPDIMAIVKKEPEGESIKAMREELIIRGK